MNDVKTNKRNSDDVHQTTIGRGGLSARLTGLHLLGLHTPGLFSEVTYGIETQHHGL